MVAVPDHEQWDPDPPPFAEPLDAIDPSTDYLNSPGAQSNGYDERVSDAYASPVDPAIEAVRASLNGQPPAASSPAPDEPATHGEPSSWVEIDLRDVRANPPGPPTVGPCFFAGKKHVIAAEPEGMKTWFGDGVSLQEIRKGNTVLWIDLEMGVGDTVARLLALGATTEELGSFSYYNPGDPLFKGAKDTSRPDALRQRIQERRPTLVVVDSFDAALELEGLDPNSTADVQNWYRLYPPLLTCSGAALVILDHLAKNKEGRGQWSIGSQRKKGGCDVHLILESVRPFSPTSTGLSKIKVSKNNNGQLPRPYLGMLTFEPASDHTNITWRIDPMVSDGADGEALGPRPTNLMQKVSRAVEQEPDGLTRAQVKAAKLGNGTFVIKAINLLIAGGWLESTDEGRTDRLRSLRPYREDTDPVALAARTQLYDEGDSDDENDL